jgi:uncharacterized membrane protein YdjX (TVP38/TMEM64 family)
MPSGFLARHPRKAAALAAITLAALAALVWLAAGHPDLTTIKDQFEKAAHWCAGQNPAIYVLALALLPYVGMPVSFLYLAAGSVYTPVEGLTLTTIGLALNLPLGFLIRTPWLKTRITRGLEHCQWRLPEVPPGHAGKLIVLTRIIPGPPLVVQNFFLALAGVPFWKYYFYSLPLAVLFAAGLILTGNAVSNGKFGLAIQGICLVVALALVAHFVKTIHNSKKQK